MTDNNIPLDISVPRNPLATRPRSVAILGLGPSIRDYVGENSRKKGLARYDEVWAVNTAHRSFRCDKIWIMDDLQKIDQSYPDWANELKMVNTPIITSRQYGEFPASIAYPLQQVVEELRDDYFSNSIAYMVAYAALIGVEELYLFGVDFHYPNAMIVESGSACVAYWLGIAKERGVHYKIPASSTLLDSNLIVPEGNPPKAKRLLYGYDYNPQDAQRKVKRGQGTAVDAAIADRAYKFTDPNMTEPEPK